MYQTPEVLDKTSHANLRYSAIPTWAFARDLATTPLAADEIERTAAHYPTVFSAEGEPALLAVLGLNGKNVYLDGNNHWTVDYIPASIRRYPFVLAQGEKNEEGAAQYFLAIDRSAPHFQNDEGDPLITDNGDLCDPAANALGFLKVLREGFLKTEVVLKAFDAQGILVAKTLTIQDGETTRMIGGFRVVDAEKLKTLPDDILAQWVRNGFLALIHAHWSSLRHLNAVAIASGRPATTN